MKTPGRPGSRETGDASTLCTAAPLRSGYGPSPGRDQVQPCSTSPGKGNQIALIGNTEQCSLVTMTSARPSIPVQGIVRYG